MCQYCGNPKKRHPKGEYYRIKKRYTNTKNAHDPIWKTRQKAKYFSMKAENIMSGKEKGEAYPYAYDAMTLHNKANDMELQRLKNSLPLHGEDRLTNVDKATIDRPFQSSRGRLLGVVLKFRNKLRIKKFKANRGIE